MKTEHNDENRVRKAIYKQRVDIISRVVADHYGISVHKMQQHIRGGSSKTARQKVQYLCRTLCPGMSLALIGEMTGNGRAFDHATVRYSWQKITDEISIYEEEKKQIDALRNKVKIAFFEAGITKGVKFCKTCGQLIV